MTSREEELRRLRELVNDERARRTRTERQLADQRADTARWRKKARRAELAAKFSLRLPSRRPQSPQASPPSRPSIAFPAIRAGIDGTPDWLDQAVETVSLGGLDEAGLAILDLVAVGGEHASPELRLWLEWSARQPLIAFSPAGDLAQVLATTECDLVVGEAAVPARGRLAALTPLPDPSAQLEIDDVAERVRGGLGRTIPTMTHRLLTAAGMDAPEPRPSVTAVAVSNRPDRISALLETLRGFDYSGLRVQLATHGFVIEASERSAAEDWFEDRIEIRHLPEDWPLGRCLNHVVESTDSDVWAKIDDDDFYGPLYIQEAVIELMASGADLVGKQTHYLYDLESDRTYLMQPGNEYRETRYVPGPTLVARRGAWERVPFAHRFARVDSTFVRGMNALGMGVYSTSRFEFAFGRGAPEAHTWQVDDSFYAARGSHFADGFPQSAIFFPRSDVPPATDWD